MNVFLKTMNAYLESIAVTLGFGALLALNPAHATTNVPIQVFLMNLSPSAITSVSWTDANGNSITSGTVPSGGLIALGSMSVPETQTNSIGISQTAANGSPINASFTLSNNCGFEPFQQALAQGQTYPSAANNVSGIYAYTTLLPIWNPSMGFVNGLTGAKNVYGVCLSNNNQFATTSVFEGYEWPEELMVFYPSAYNSNLQPVVLGSYVPTGANWNTSAAPAFYNVGATASAQGLTLSPTGLTTYIGTSVVVPYNGSDFSYWPVTIYYGVDSGGNSAIPLVAPTMGPPNAPFLPNEPYTTVNLSTASSETSPADAVNVPAYFTNFQDSGVESAYMPPNAGNQSVNGNSFPMPCWPVFNSSNNAFTGCNGSPQYVSNGTTTAKSNSLLTTLNGLIATAASLITIVAVF